ncbi:MAG: hypothetical protein ABIG67_08070 [Pseudomonadota bacterium]
MRILSSSIPRFLNRWGLCKWKTSTYDYMLLALGLNLLFFHPILFSDKTLYFRDIHLWFYPMKYFLATSLKNGLLPFWCPDTFCGAPFMSDLQSGVFYPISLLFLFLPFPKSLNIYVVFHLFLGFCFFYQFIKDLGLSRKAALLTSISYGYGSYTIATINTLNNLSAVVWLPAILWSFQRAVTKRGKSGPLCTLFFLCTALIGGEPQLFFLSTGLLLLYGLTSIHKGKGIGPGLKNGLIILILILFAAAITLPQLGPAYLDYNLSVRSGGISYEEATRFSLNPSMLKHLFVPLRFYENFVTDPSAIGRLFPGHAQMPWLLTVFPGMMIAPAALFGLLFNFSKRLLLWPVTFFISLVLALGDYTPIYQVFYNILPFFRFPAKFIFLTGFALLVMAAYGFDRLFTLLEQKGVKAGLLFALLGLLMVVDLYSAHRSINPSIESSFYQAHHPALKPILDDPEHFRIYVDPERIAPSPGRGSILDHHIQWQMLLMPNLGLLHRLHHVDGVSGLELRYQYVISEILQRPWKERIRFLRLANVKYIISAQSLDKKPEIKDQVSKINALVYRIKDVLPRAWIIGELKPIIKGTWEDIIDPSFDPSSSALAKGPLVDRYKQPFSGQIEKIRYEENGRIRIRLTTGRPGVLVLAESSYPGWKVFVDGKERECLWLDLLFQGVEVQSGTHMVDFVYRPKHFKLYLIIASVSTLLFLFIWIGYCRFMKKGNGPVQPLRHEGTKPALARL